MRAVPMIVLPLLAALLAAAAPGASAPEAGTGPASPPPMTGKAPPPPLLAAAPDDPLDALYRPSLELGPDAQPRVTVRIMDGQSRVALRAVGGGLVARPRPAPGEPARTARVPEGATIVVTMADHDPGEIRSYPIVSEHRPGDVDGIAKAETAWRGRGFAVRTADVGSVFGLGGRVVDNRRTFVLLDGPGTAAWAQATLAKAEPFLDRAPVLHEVLVRRPAGHVEVRDAEGHLLVVGDTLVSFEAEGGGRLLVSDVEYGVGYKWHGREDRSYVGTLHVVADPRGLSLVDALPLETLLRGVVPAETYASAPLEALEAQAVSARSEILAKIGVRHLADPALLCAAQHCQVYKGLGAGTPATDRAVEATKGEVLLGTDGRVVDAVYSAVCGGHTENNDVVWGQSPDPSLRGVPDFEAEGAWRRFAAGIGSDDLEAWLDSSPPAFCNSSSFRQPSRFRWTKRIPADEMKSLTARLGVGEVRRIEVLGRGVSGRAKAVRVVGAKGSAVVHFELPIRRLFGNLNSAMFVVHPEPGPDGRPTAFVFKGGGWGHGVGMCQVGAIGMAEQGYDHRAILRHYYNGAGVIALYGAGPRETEHPAAAR